MGPILLICLGGILIALVVYIGINRAINQRWLKSPPKRGQIS